MKKFLSIFFVLVLALTITLKASAISFKDAISVSDKKPVLMLIYADWADDYENYLSNFRETQKFFGSYFNYVEMDIASPEMKDFNSMYQLYPNVPYILMIRNSGKISRYIDRNCANNTSCIITKIQSFIK